MDLCCDLWNVPLYCFSGLGKLKKKAAIDRGYVILLIRIMLEMIYFQSCEKNNVELKQIKYG